MLKIHLVEIFFGLLQVVKDKVGHSVVVGHVYFSIFPQKMFSMFQNIGMIHPSTSIDDLNEIFLKIQTVKKVENNDFLVFLTSVNHIKK